jgi:hypothetical protein
MEIFMLLIFFFHVSFLFLFTCSWASLYLQACSFVSISMKIKRNEKKNERKKLKILIFFQAKNWTGRFSRTVTGSPVPPVHSGSRRFRTIFYRFLRPPVFSFLPDRCCNRFPVQPVEPAGPVLTTLVQINILQIERSNSPATVIVRELKPLDVRTDPELDSTGGEN